MVIDNLMYILSYYYYYFFNPGRSPRCFKNLSNLSNTKISEMTTNPYNPWTNRRAGELR